MQFITFKAFVLKKTKFSESDLILQLLTQNGEKVSCLARGALKSKKRFSGGILDPLHLIEVQIQLGKHEDSLASLQEAKLIEDFNGLKKDYDRLETALACLEITEKVATRGFSNASSLYDLLGHTLKKLEDYMNPEQLKSLFFLKLLFEQGVLDIEPWMHPLLNIKISSLNTDQNFSEHLPHLKCRWIQEQISLYSKQGSI